MPCRQAFCWHARCFGQSGESARLSTDERDPTRSRQTSRHRLSVLSAPAQLYRDDSRADSPDGPLKLDGMLRLFQIEAGVVASPSACPGVKTSIPNGDDEFSGWHGQRTCEVNGISASKRVALSELPSVTFDFRSKFDRPEHDRHRRLPTLIAKQGPRAKLSRAAGFLRKPRDADRPWMVGKCGLAQRVTIWRSCGRGPRQLGEAGARQLLSHRRRRARALRTVWRVRRRGQEFLE